MKHCLFILLMLLQGCTTAPDVVVVEPLACETPDGPVRGYLARVDLTDPAVEVFVTAPVGQSAEHAANTEAYLKATPEWVRRNGLTLAINANYFGLIDAETADTDARPADIIGLCMSRGELLSEQRVYRGQAGPALVIDRNGRASISTRPDLSLAHHAVAGVGPSDAEPRFGGLLVTDGVNTGATARVEPLTRHPRTAVGTDREGRTLWLVVIDGRQPGWSVGATLPELAALLIEAGVNDAVNLDGGGSSSFYYLQPTMRGDSRSLTISNKPSDGRHRPVACHLGIRLRTPE